MVKELNTYGIATITYEKLQTIWGAAPLFQQEFGWNRGATPPLSGWGFFVLTRICLKQKGLTPSERVKLLCFNENLVETENHHLF